MRQSINNNIPFIVFSIKLLEEMFNLFLIDQLRGIIQTFLEAFKHVFRKYAAIHDLQHFEEEANKYCRLPSREIEKLILLGKVLNG